VNKTITRYNVVIQEREADEQRVKQLIRNALRAPAKREELIYVPNAYAVGTKLQLATDTTAARRVIVVQCQLKDVDSPTVLPYQILVRDE